MKKFDIAMPIVVLLLSIGLVNAEQPGAIPNDMLGQMGLGGMQTMSDAEGLNVRGMGTASVSGSMSISVSFPFLFPFGSGNVFVSQSYSGFSNTSSATTNGSFSASAFRFGGVVITGSGSAFASAK